MKLRANSLLTLISMAFLGIIAMLATATTAQAQTLVDTHVRNGITCKKYTAQTSWPTHFWNCDPNVTAANARNVTNGAAALPAHLRVSPVNTYEHYLFRNAADFAAYAGVTAPPAKSHGAYANGVDGYPPIAAVFANVTQNGQAVVITPNPGYRVHMAQIMGRLVYSKLIVGVNPTVQTHFLAAVNYDAAYVDENPPKGKAVVWPSIYTQYPSLNAWGILDQAYGASPEEVFGYQFGRKASVGATVAPLNGALDDMPNTFGIVQYYVWNPTPPASTARFAAKSKLTNGVYVLCVIQDHTNNSPIWPNKYWNCVHPYEPNTPEMVALDSIRRTNGSHIPSAWRTDLQNADVQIHIMRDVRDWKDFYNYPTDPEVGVYGISKTADKRTAVFRDVQTSSGVWITNQGQGFYQNSVNHELGHQLDAIKGNPSQRQSFTNAINADRTQFNLPNTSCFTAIDQWLPAAQRLCSTWSPQLSNWEIAKQKKGVDMDNNGEAFARAFAQQLIGDAEPFVDGVQSLLTQENSWMAGAFSSGTFPPN